MISIHVRDDVGHSLMCSLDPDMRAALLFDGLVQLSADGQLSFTDSAMLADVLRALIAYGD